MSESTNNENTKSTAMSRSHFIGTTAAAAAAFTIVPRNVLGGPGYQAPSDMVNVAGIGVGSQGGNDIRGIKDPEVEVAREGGGFGGGGGGWTGGGNFQPPAGAQAPAGAPQSGQPAAQQQERPEPEPVNLANIYALCDVDSEYASRTFAQYPSAKTYSDWRRMLDREPEIDAVVIGTPDHNHAPIAAAFMKAGKHVYVEKPMCKTVFETRELRRIAEENNVVTQMGNQGHNSDGSFRAVEWIRAGVLGDVREVRLATNRPIWPQGNLQRPEGIRVPRTLNWDVWLGPAPVKPYHPDVCHFDWRGLWDYGTGAIGDMGAHIYDVCIWALELGLPTTIQANSTAYSSEYLPQAEVIVYEFPARGSKPPVTVSWVDGGLTALRHPALPDGVRTTSAMIIGSNGTVLTHSDYGGRPALYRNGEALEIEPAEPSLPRMGNIFEDWINAIKNGTKSTNDFTVSAHLTEIMLLGVLAVATKGYSTTLKYDGENMAFTNLPEADEFLHYEYRQGWTL